MTCYEYEYRHFSVRTYTCACIFRHTQQQLTERVTATSRRCMSNMSWVLGLGKATSTAIYGATVMIDLPAKE